MRWHTVLCQITKVAQSIFNNIEKRFKAGIEPSSDSEIGGVAAELVKSK
jgi:hypothetical protein